MKIKEILKKLVFISTPVLQLFSIKVCTISISINGAYAVVAGNLSDNTSSIWPQTVLVASCLFCHFFETVHIEYWTYVSDLFYSEEKVGIEQYLNKVVSIRIHTKMSSVQVHIQFSTINFLAVFVVSLFSIALEAYMQPNTSTALSTLTSSQLRVPTQNYIQFAAADSTTLYINGKKILSTSNPSI